MADAVESWRCFGQESIYIGSTKGVSYFSYCILVGITNFKHGLLLHAKE
jgi:hypothetical protein